MGLYGDSRWTTSTVRASRTILPWLVSLTDFWTGAYRIRDPRTVWSGADRSELVRDFQNFVGFGPVRASTKILWKSLVFENPWSPSGSVRFLGFWSWFLKFSRSWPGPRSFQLNSLKIRLVKIAESWSVQSTVSMSCFGRCHDTSTPDFIWNTRQFVEAKLSWRKIKHQRIKLMRLCHQIFPRSILRIQIALGLSPHHQDSYSITGSKPEVTGSKTETRIFLNSYKDIKWPFISINLKLKGMILASKYNFNCNVSF